MFKLLYTKSLCLSTESRVVCKSHTRLYSGRTVGERHQVGEEVVEAPLELAPRVEQVTRGRLQLRLAREAPGEVRQRDADAVDVAIREQPLLVAHVGIDEAEPPRQRVRVRIDRGVDARDEDLQRLVAVARPTVGQEMVEEDVGDDARVVAVIGDEHAPEGGDAGVAVGEGVDSPMVPDSLGDGIAAANRSLDEVAGEIGRASCRERV